MDRREDDAQRETTTGAAPSASTTSGDDHAPQERPRWVLLREEARVRGFRNALSFKRWCDRHQVALRRDGKMLWVRSEDVDRAVGGLPIRSTTPAVISAVEAIKRRRKQKG